MEKLYFNEAVYAAKQQFILTHCRNVQLCKNCSSWSKKGCTDPNYPKGKLLTTDKNAAVVDRPKNNNASCAFDHSHGKFRLRVNNPDIGQKTVGFIKHSDHIEACLIFIKDYPYINTQEEYETFKTEFQEFKTTLD